MNWTVIDWVGFAGGVLLLFGFWRTSIGRWKTTSVWYEFDNLLGCALLFIYAWDKQAYVNIVLNIIWGIVAFRGLASYAERRKLANAKAVHGIKKRRNGRR